MSDDLRLMICTPSPGYVTATFAADLAAVAAYSRAAVAIVSGSQINSLRTALLNAAIASGASHALFLDADMRFPRDTGERLYKRNKDIVGANYPVRTSALKQWTAHVGPDLLDSSGKTGIERVDSLGFGAILINLDIVPKLDEPWFQMPWNGTDFVTEDIFFCRNATDKGIEVWVDHDLTQGVRHTASIEKGVVDVRCV